MYLWNMASVLQEGEKDPESSLNSHSNQNAAFLTEFRVSGKKKSLSGRNIHMLAYIPSTLSYSETKASTAGMKPNSKKTISALMPVCKL